MRANACLLLLAALCALVAPFALSAQKERPDATDVRQLIVKLKAPVSAHRELAPAELDALGHAAAESLAYHRRMGGGAHVLRLPRWMTFAQASAIAERLGQLPMVEYAEPDRRVYPSVVPDDDFYGLQWHYRGPDQAVQGGANLELAWDITTGGAGVVVAVLDTGQLPHADIDSNITDMNGRVTPGYDFISDTCVAGDGNGRDGNPTDPGDFASANECFPGQDAATSSWHGTHVAGTIGALGNNADGVAGVNWVSRIQPLRVLGKGGGDTSDIVDAIRWAAGDSISGVTDNPTPARVINLSLGGAGPCSTAEQNAINYAVGQGAVVVVAAGNESVSISTSNASPANCANVITVAATDRDGQLASYSNFGSRVEISAPGGDFPCDEDTGVTSTYNTGTTTAGSDAYATTCGTSQATPHVSGVVSLLLSAAPSLTPAQVLQILQDNARAFPVLGSISDCTTSKCGAGLLDAEAVLASTGDTTPDAFSFTDLADRPRSTLTTSDPIMVAGLEHRAAIAVSGGQYSIDGGAFTSTARRVANGQTVRVRHTTSSAYGSTVNTILTIGGVSDTFTTTTVVDATPDKFRFRDQYGVARNTVIVSKPVVIGGLAAAAPVSVTGGEHSIGCTGSFTSSAGMISNGQTVCVRHTSAAAFSTRVDTTLTIGGLSGVKSDTFSSTTESRLLRRLLDMLAGLIN